MTRRYLRTRSVDVTETGHLTELLYDDGASSELLVCAGHGGSVEPGTAELALELAVAHETAVCWTTLGYESDGSAFESWHPPSTAIDPDSYPLLGEIADRGFERVLSIHGLGDDAALVGGGVDGETKARVADHLDPELSVPVSVADDTGQYAGTHRENFVNWLAAGDGGLQLELGPTVRQSDTDTLLDSIHEMLERGLL